MLTIHIRPEQDQTGALEELTWDLWPLVAAEHTLHLDTHGLPKPGTQLVPGMILVGKIGKTRAYNPDAQPTALEKHSLDLETLRQKYGAMWRDGSVLVTTATSGVVRQAYLSTDAQGPGAIVEIEQPDYASFPKGPEKYKTSQNDT